MRRHLFNFAAVVSLMLCLLSLVIRWVSLRTGTADWRLIQQYLSAGRPPPNRDYAYAYLTIESGKLVLGRL